MGQFKDSDNKVKVSCILNWLGDEAFLIYDNLAFAEPTDKDLPDKVLDAFLNYLKPERNVFIHGIHWEASTLINSRPSLTFIITYRV